MDAERYERLCGLFQAACELNADARRRYLDEACGRDAALRQEVEGLLERDARESPALAVEPGADDVRRGAVERLAASMQRRVAMPETLGGYRIVRVIAEGGMGTVYEARQETPRRTVAMKVVRPGVASERLLRRFEHEAHVLGLLQHPGIAQIHEAGTVQLPSGAQPFFVMELVDGEPITTFADSRRLGVRDRLALMADVCDAVHHAHQKGVVHRDLKPSNILVGDAPDQSGDPASGTRVAGRVKVVDFGVARVTDVDIRTTTLQTEAGQLVGTVPYMSPEQAAGDPHDIDTRSDVYALGVVAYELLAGRLPYDLDEKLVHEAVRTIREETPVRLSAVSREFRGDTETIVAKALEKEKERRYESAASLAADIRRSLNDEPIVARPPSATYQFAKFARRNRGMVAIAGVAVLMLMAAVGGTSFGLVKADRQRDLATARAADALKARNESDRLRDVAEERLLDATRAEEQATAVTAFLSQMLASSRPGRMGDDVRVVDVLDRAAAEIGAELVDQPVVEANLRTTIGRTYSQLGSHRKAIAQLETAGAIYRRELGPTDGSSVQAAIDLGKAFFQSGKYERAVDVLDRSHARAVDSFGVDDERTVEVLFILSRCYADMGRLDDAIAVAETMLEVCRDSGSAHPLELSSVSQLACRYLAADMVPAAESLLADTMSGPEVGGGVSPDAPELMEALGHVYLARGRLDDAVVILAEALAAYERGHPPGHAMVVSCRISLGRALMLLEDYEAAEEMLQEAVDCASIHDVEMRWVAVLAVVELSRALVQQGRFPEAEDLLTRTLASCNDVLGENARFTADVRVALANLHYLSGRPTSAASMYEHTLSAARSEGRQAELLGPVVGLISVRLHQGRPQEARALLEEYLDAPDAPIATKSTHEAALLVIRAEVSSQSGDLDQAEQFALRAVEESDKLYGRGHAASREARKVLSSVYGAQRRWGEAEDLLIELASDAAARSHLGDSAAYLFSRGRLCEATGRLTEAEALFGESLELRWQVGEFASETLQTSAALAGVQSRLGHHEVARARLENVTEELRRRQPASAVTVEALNTLGEVVNLQGRLGEAAAIFEESLATADAVFGPRHPVTMGALGGLAKVYYNAERDEEALSLQLRIINETRRHRPARDHHLGFVLSSHAVSLAALGRYDEAAAALVEAADALDGAVGTTHFDSRRARQLLVNVYQKMWQPARAAATRAELREIEWSME